MAAFLFRGFWVLGVLLVPVLGLAVFSFPFELFLLLWAVLVLGFCLFALLRRPGSSPSPSPSPSSPPASLRLLVVFNPSKVSDPVARRREVEAELGRYAPSSIGWVETTVDDPGTEAVVAALSEGVDVVVACGGDGTVLACAEALVGSEVPLAVLPSGTGNVLAEHLALSPDLPSACRVVFEGVRYRIDVGVVNDHVFLVACGMGFDAELLSGASPSLKRLAGFWAYVLSGVRRLLGRGAVFEVSGDVRLRRWGRSVLVANTAFSSRVPLLPGVDPCDGRLDLLVLSPGSLLGWVRLSWAVLRRRRSELLSSASGAVFEVSSSRPLPWERDGEVCGLTDRLVVSVRPAALTLLRPAPVLDGSSPDPVVESV